MHYLYFQCKTVALAFTWILWISIDLQYNIGEAYCKFQLVAVIQILRYQNKPVYSVAQRMQLWHNTSPMAKIKTGHVTSWNYVIMCFWELNTVLFDIMWHIFLNLTLCRHVLTIHMKCPVVNRFVFHFRLFRFAVGCGGGWAEFTKFVPSCS
jgi:hypothetical protein